MFNIIVPLIFFSSPIIIIVGISLAQIYDTKRLLKNLESRNLTKFKIRFNQSSTGIGRVSGGLSMKAQLYFNDEILVIGPKEKGYFTALFNLNMPIVFVREESINNTLNYNLRVPDKFKISAWKSITIKYKKPRVSFSIQINLLDKKGKEKIELFRVWER